MGINMIPYTNVHELNLDWIVSRIKDVDESRDRAIEAETNAAQSAEDSQASADDSADSAAASQAYAEDSAASALESDNYAKTAEAWSTGEVSGVPVPEEAPQYENNSKYYMELAKEYAESIGDPVADIVTQWLDDNVDPVGSAVIVDSSLTISGAAADAAVVGEKAMLFRGAISANADIDDLEIGTYTKGNGVVVVNGVNSYGATVVCFIPSSTAYRKAQIWCDSSNNALHYRVFGSEEWTAWSRFDNRTSVMSRNNLTAADDCDLLDSGFYYKDGNITVTNGVNARMAEIVSFKLVGREFGSGQLWFDCTNAALYYRTQDMYSTWSDWKSIGRSTSASITVALSECSVAASHGLWASGIGNFGKSTGFTKRLKTHGATSLTIDWTAVNSSGGSFKDLLNVMKYGADGSYLGSVQFTSADSSTGAVTSIVTLDATVDSVILGFYNNSGSADLPTDTVTITAANTNVLDFAKNPAFAPNAGDWYRFGYKVGDYENDSGAVKAIYNTGMIMFPPNYSVDGPPVPVILYSHGSDAYTNINGSQYADYAPYFRYLRDNGFAIIDCYGWTNRYTSQSGYYNPWVMPTTCLANKRLLELVLDNFNLDPDNIFTFCKSQGGMLSQWLAGNIPGIRASVFHAPAVSTRFGYTGSAYRTAMITDLGLVGVVNSSLGWATEDACLEDFKQNYYSPGWSSAKKQAFFLANEDQLAGWLNQFVNVTGQSVSDNLTDAANEVYRDTLCRSCYPPSKLWVASDDTAISVSACTAFMQQLRNGGCEGHLRILPSGTGGHHAMDTDPAALQKTNVVTKLGITYATIPLAYWESVQFMIQHLTYRS